MNERCAETDPLNLRLRAAELLVGWWPPFVASRLRSRIVRGAGLKVGRTSVFWGFPTVVGSGAGMDRLRIGEACGFNAGCYFDLSDEIVIDDDVSVGHEVMFLTRSWELGDASRRAARPKVAPIRIHRGVWLGARATVMPGVTIGEGAVIGASAVVEHDVRPNTLVMGTQKISLAKWRTG